MHLSDKAKLLDREFDRRDDADGNRTCGYMV